MLPNDKRSDGTFGDIILDDSIIHFRKNVNNTDQNKKEKYTIKNIIINYLIVENNYILPLENNTTS